MKSITLISVLVLAFSFMNVTHLYGQTACKGVCNLIEFTFSHRSNAVDDCDNTASGSCSFAVGESNTASGNTAIAAGSGNLASGTSSIAAGSGNEVTNAYSVALGSDNVISRTRNVAIGASNTILADSAYTIGIANTVNSTAKYSMLLGSELTTDSSGVFMMGWKKYILYADYRDPGLDGFIGININATVSTTDNIDLSVKSHAEKGAGGSTWISPSDRRLKTGIRPFTDGLDVVRRMEPVWYSYNGTLGLESERPEVGIIAQDVREVAPYMVSGSEGEGSYLTYNANALFYLLVNAVKEQQESIEVLEAENIGKQEAIEQLQAENSQLREDFGQRLADLEQILQGRPAASGNVGSNARQTVTLQGQNADAPVLYQNIPNPFSGETLVRYYVPASATKAELVVTTAATGAVLDRIALAHTGPGEVALRTERLAAGTYTYTLVVDGQPVATRQMLLNN